MGTMNTRHSTPSKAVAAGTAAGLRHLERAYIAKVNAAVADDRSDLAHELADDLLTATGGTGSLAEDADVCRRRSVRQRPMAYRLFTR
jgi:hypothetical protein